jgi:hypothetical protein
VLWYNQPRWGCSDEFIRARINDMGVKYGWGVGDGGEGEYEEGGLGGWILAT